MTEEERLFSEVEKLEAQPGDVIVIQAGQITHENVDALREIAGVVSNTFKCLVLLMNKGDCIRKLDEETMEAYGWVRKA